jgi:transcriptional regulator with XRE-family HTH domain
MGRKKFELDYELVERLASIHCTQEEIAMVLGVSRPLIAKRKKTDKKFNEAYNRGRQKGKTSLRKALYESAIKRNNTTAIIFLAKNWLGMSDKAEIRHDVEHSGEVHLYLPDNKRLETDDE